MIRRVHRHLDEKRKTKEADRIVTNLAAAQDDGRVAAYKAKVI